MTVGNVTYYKFKYGVVFMYNVLLYNQVLICFEPYDLDVYSSQMR